MGFAGLISHSRYSFVGASIGFFSAMVYPVGLQLTHYHSTRANWPCCMMWEATVFGVGIPRIAMAVRLVNMAIIHFHYIAVNAADVSALPIYAVHTRGLPPCRRVTCCSTARWQNFGWQAVRCES